MQFKLQEATKQANEKEKKLSEANLDKEEMLLKIEELEENVKIGDSNQEKLKVLNRELEF